MTKLHNTYGVEVFWEEYGSHSGWIARFKEGGPDICAQGDTIIQALERLHVTATLEALECGGSLIGVPKRP